MFEIDLSDYFRFPTLHQRAIRKIQVFLEGEAIPGTVTITDHVIRGVRATDAGERDWAKFFEVLLKFIEALMKLFGD